MKSVSIIVPVYYGEKYIEGIIKQAEDCRKYLEAEDLVEVLFVNDAPEAPLCHEWESEWIHIVVINTDRNVGIQGARLKGLKRCQGEYVLFLDQDDRIKPEYLHSQFQAMGKSDAVVCRAIYGKILFYSEYPIFENILSKDLMLSQWDPIISPGQVLLKKQSIPDIWMNNILRYNGADDWLLWLCMLSEKCLFTLNQEVLYEHVLSGTNTSDDIVGMLQSEQEVMGIVQEKRLFSDHDFELLMKGFFLKNLRRTQELYFYKKKFNLLDKWIKLKENNIRYSEYLAQAGVRSVAIYGCGTFGEFLFTELKDTMEVKYFIDQNANEICKNISVYSLENNLPKVDGVVITLIGETDEVEKVVKENISNNVFVLKNWLMEAEL